MKIIFVILISFASFAGAQSSNVPFLIVYKEENVSILKGLRGLKLQSYLKAQTARNENRLVQKIPAIRGLSRNEASTLWILNSSILKINSLQASEIQKLPFVNRVIQLIGSAELIRPLQSQGPIVENTQEFTYGLIKIGIPEVRSQYQNLTGEGVRVGIIDTGIDSSHPDLFGKVIRYRSFVDSDQKPSDQVGHGTHVAGTIAGGNFSGRAIGVAPASRLIIAKVFSRSSGASLENLLLSLQWMTDPDGNSETDDGAHVVNNSWGANKIFSNLDPQDEPFCAVLNRMRAMNVVPVFASGNSGPGDGTVSIPGACPDSLTVGATNSKDSIARFSSKGPAKWKSISILKPEISAPGVDVISSMPNKNFTAMSGTSMAAPHVTGVIALMKQAKPDLNHKQLSELVISTSQDLGVTGHDFSFGYGRLDAKKVILNILAQGRR